MADQLTLKEILGRTISSNPEDQKLALQYLEQAAVTNYPEFIKQLSELLASTAENEGVCRSAAGLQLKNQLTSKDSGVKADHIKRWNSLQPDVRNVVKNNVLRTLGTESQRPSTAAQCVSAIACAEAPDGPWPEMLKALTDNVTNPNSEERLKEASLEAVGYMCGDMDPAVLGSCSNSILTAIVHGMKKTEGSDHVRGAATVALLNSLEFTRSNFEEERERDVIMQVVCEATQSTNTLIRVTALQCLVKIMSLYYQFMERYMGQALFAITVMAMKSEEDDIALQGIEFWSNVCDEEINLAILSSEAEEQGHPPDLVSKFYAKGALPHLTPILLQTLVKQEENVDEDDWIPAKAAGVCLMLLTQCTGDDVVPICLQFISDNINHEDWKFRDAAMMTFGSILEGPDVEKLKPVVEQALPIVIKRLEDPHPGVKDTAAWCVGRICELIPVTVINEGVLAALLPALSTALSQEPRVAANVCWAISSLASSAYNAAREGGHCDETGEPKTYILSSCFEAIVNALIQTTDRADGLQSNLRNAAYEALMELIKFSPSDCYAVVGTTTVFVLERLQRLLAMENEIRSSNEISQYHDLQALLCAMLQSVMRKVKPEDAARVSELAMQALLQVLPKPGESKGSGVQEDALMAVSTIIDSVKTDFLRYMEAFKPCLYVALENHAEYQVCSAAVGLVGDLSRGLGAEMAPFTDDIMSRLFNILQDPSIDQSVKPSVLSVFGDIALALEAGYMKYLEFTLMALVSSFGTQVNREDYDELDFLEELRVSCLEGFTGILQGMRSNQAELAKLIQPHLEAVVKFLELLLLEPPSDTLLAAASGFIGDLASTFGSSILPVLEQPVIIQFLTKARSAKSSKAKNLGFWATKEIKKLKNNTVAG